MAKMALLMLTVLLVLLGPTVHCWSRYVTVLSDTHQTCSLLYVYIVTPTDVYVDTLRSFNGVPTDPECTSGGPFDRTPGTNTNFACNIPASRLTDGVLGESSPANFNQFSAWNRTTDMPRIFFLFPDPGTVSPDPPGFFVRQIDLYFYKSAALRVGLTDVRLDLGGSNVTPQPEYLGVPYTIVSNQSISESENQTVKVSLVDTLGQNSFVGYPNNVIVRLTFDFSSSDTLDWILLSEVSMFNDTGEYSLLAQ